MTASSPQSKIADNEFDILTLYRKSSSIVAAFKYKLGRPECYQYFSRPCIKPSFGCMFSKKNQLNNFIIIFFFKFNMFDFANYKELLDMYVKCISFVARSLLYYTIL